MSLLIDMGNTRLKWTVLENGDFMTGQPLLNTQLNQSVLLNAWQALTPPKQVVIGCVTATQSLDLVTAVTLALWSDIEISRVSSQAYTFGITNAYTPPEKLGVDRWLALVAARHSYSLPACIVDCGTAITVDLLDTDGQHLGGFISAGITLMKQSLAHGTNALPFNTSPHSLAPAKFTEAAIYSGTLLAAVGLIEKVLAKQVKPMSLILTGGDAALIAPHLSVTPLIDADLVLRGLAIVANAKT
ncbi:MAG: type III pantothenate kinase [Methylococcales bacterium]|nr:type III pantothenate kinase [Methylococcales bacterium]